MRKFVRLAACVLLAAILFSSCGSGSGGAVKSGTLSNVLKDETPSAYEMLNEEERALFDPLAEAIAQAFCDDASEVHVEKIYRSVTGPMDEEEGFSVFATLRGTGKLSGALSREYAVLASLEDGPLSIEYGDIPESSQPVPKTEMDPAKINAALKEYWSGAGMHDEDNPPADGEKLPSDEEKPFSDEGDSVSDGDELPFDVNFPFSDGEVDSYSDG